MTKQLFAVLIMLVCLKLSAQNNPSQKLVLQMPAEEFGGHNGASIVWHPVQKKYVSAIAGNASFPVAVFDEKGKRLSNDAAQSGFDARGLWYNPDKQQIQGNAYKDGGWFAYTIAPDNSVASKQIFAGSNQPDAQSVGFYITPIKKVGFLNGANITVYNPTDAVADAEKSFSLQPLNNGSEEIEELSLGYNTSTAAYTGKKNYEIALLNTATQQVELYDLQTHKCTGIAKITGITFDLKTLFNFTYCNDYFWFFDDVTRSWYGYKLTIEKPSVNTASTGTVSNATNLYNEAIKLKGEKNYTTAITKLQQSIAADSKYYDAYYQLAWCYNETSNYAKAIETANKAIAVKSTDNRIYQEKAYALKQSGKYEDAIASYQKTIDLNPKASIALKEMGDTYVLMKQDEKAFTYYQKCIAIDPLNAGANFEVAYYYNQRDRYAEALPYIKKATEQKPNTASYTNEMGFTYYKLKMNDEAIAAYNKSIISDNNNALAYKGIGDVYRVNYKPAKVTEAMGSYEKSVAKDPAGMGACYGLGWCYNNQARYDDAIRVMEKALTNNNKYILILTELGYSYYAKQNYTEALKNLNNSIAIDNKQRLAHYYKGLCYCMQKDKSSATDAYNKLLPLDNDLAQKLMGAINKL